MAKLRIVENRDGGLTIYAPGTIAGVAAERVVGRLEVDHRGRVTLSAVDRHRPQLGDLVYLPAGEHASPEDAVATLRAILGAAPLIEPIE